MKNLFEELMNETEREFEKLQETKENVWGSIVSRHEALNSIISHFEVEQFEEEQKEETNTNENINDDIDKVIDKTSTLLDELLADLI